MALAPALALVDEPDRPGEKHATPAVHDVQPVKVALRHSQLAQLERVNKNEQGPKASGAIAAGAKFAHETGAGTGQRRIEVQHEHDRGENGEAQEMPELVVF